MQNALFGQYNIQLEFMDSPSLLYPNSNLRDLSGYLPPIVLKHFEMINHLNNTIIRLQAELDKQLQLIQEGKAKQTDFDQYRQKLQQLTLIQYEKINYASLALAELKQCRNQIAMRYYMEERKADENIPDVVVSQKSSTLDSVQRVPYSSQDLLLNVKCHAASGLLGNSLVLPVRDKDIGTFKQHFDVEADDFNRKDLGGLTLFCDPELLVENLSELHKTVISCLAGRLYVSQKPTVVQEDIVPSAFAEAGMILDDAAQLPKREVATDKVALIKDLQDKFKLATRKLEQSIQKVDKDDREKKMRQRMKIGQIIQNGCLPFFSQVENLSISNLSSTVNETSISQSVNAQTYGGSAEQDNDEASILLEEDEKSREDEVPLRQSPQAGQQQVTDRQPTINQQYSPQMQRQLQQMQQVQQQQMQYNMQQAQLLQQRQLQQQATPHRHRPHPKSTWNENYCVVGYCKVPQDEDNMVMCEQDTKCRYAKDGWFHPACLGFLPEDNRIFDQVEFYCPGCWVDSGKSFSDWGVGFNVMPRRLQQIKKGIVEIWQNQYGINIKRK